MIGLRPGEKQREELTVQGLELLSTAHPSICVARQAPFDAASMRAPSPNCAHASGSGCGRSAGGHPAGRSRVRAECCRRRRRVRTPSRPLPRVVRRVAAAGCARIRCSAATVRPRLPPRLARPRSLRSRPSAADPDSGRFHIILSPPTLKRRRLPRRLHASGIGLVAEADHPCCCWSELSSSSRRSWAAT